MQHSRGDEADVVQRQYNQFAARLAEHLTQCGITTTLDVNGLPIGGNIDDFLNHIDHVNFVICIYTPLFHERDQIVGSGVNREVNLILRRNQAVLIPLLLDGTPETSIPERLGRRLLYIDFTNRNDYYGNFLDMLDQRLLNQLRIDRLDNHIGRCRDDIINQEVNMFLERIPRNMTRIAGAGNLPLQIMINNNTNEPIVMVGWHCTFGRVFESTGGAGYEINPGRDFNMHTSGGRVEGVRGLNWLGFVFPGVEAIPTLNGPEGHLVLQNRFNRWAVQIAWNRSFWRENPIDGAIIMDASHRNRVIIERHIINADRVNFIFR